jgi:hypothetical protein
MRILILIIASAALGGCAALSYTLVNPGAAAVANASMTISPSGEWNRAPSSAEPTRNEENWTRNGFMLDRIQFVGALPDGQALVKQREKADRQVPTFHPTMTPTDLTSMVESMYRIGGRAKVFTTTSVKPVTFLGQNGVQFDYDFVGDDDIRWRGRSVMAVASGKLYLMTLNGTSLHYFDAALPEFNAMVASAAVR